MTPKNKVLLKQAKELWPWFESYDYSKMDEWTGTQFIVKKHQLKFIVDLLEAIEKASP